MDLEDSDIEFEKLEEEEKETSEGLEEIALKGVWIPFSKRFTGKRTQGVSEKKLKKLLGVKKSLQDIPAGMRGDVYRFFEKQLERLMTDAMRGKLELYGKVAQDIKISKVGNSSGHLTSPPSF